MTAHDSNVRLFWDEHGLLVQHYGGGGETLADCGTYIVGKHLVANDAEEKYMAMIAARQMWITLGFPTSPSRHPVTIPGPQHVSYDQMNSNIIGMGLMGFRPWIRTILGTMIRNWMRYPNGDPASPERLAVFFRALGWWWMYPWFLMSDAWMLFVQLPWLLAKRKPPGRFRKWLFMKTNWKWLIKDHGGVYGRMNVGDCRNYRLALIQANLVYGTWFSGLALVLYDMWFSDAWTIFFQRDNRLDVLYGELREQT